MDNKEVTPPYKRVDFKKPKRRRNLLPWWVIGSIWIFLVFFALMPVGIVFGLLRRDFTLSLLGIETRDPFSLSGIFLILLFALKGVTAFALWTEKRWAVGLAKIDAAISIAVCCLTMTGPFLGFGHVFSLRLELIIVIPYFYKMNSIQYDWLYFNDEKESSPEGGESPVLPEL